MVREFRADQCVCRAGGGCVCAQVRLLEEVQEVLASFDGGRSTTAHMRRDRAWDGYAEAQPHGRRASAPIVRRPRPPVEGCRPLAAYQPT